MSPLALSLRFLQAQPDHRLAELARNGHEPAFEALVRRYRGELLAYCRRLQPTTGSAEDALQQTFLQAWKALNAGTEVRELRPWLYRIAHNVSLNSLRVLNAVPAEVPETAGAQDVDHLVEQRLRIRAAFAELAALPALQRQAFVSSTLDGASHDEVAASLGVSSGAVRGLIYRARSAMRAAAAAVTPSPVVGWAVRRAETQTGATATVAQALAGGGGTGLVAVLAKGGAVLTLAGAVAGAGGAILTPAQHHGHGGAARTVESSQVGLVSAGNAPGAARTVLLASATGHGGATPGAGPGAPLAVVIARGPHSLSAAIGRPADRHGSAGSGARSSGRSGGGSGPSVSSGSSGGSDSSPSGSGSSGGSNGGPPGGGTGRSDGGSSGGSDGGSSGGSDGGSSSGTATVAGSDGGTSGGGSSGSGGDRTTTTRTSDGGSGSDGGSSGGDSGPRSGSGSSGSVSSSTTSESH